MTPDIQELRRLAEARLHDTSDYITTAWLDYTRAVSDPDTILALIAEMIGKARISVSYEPNSRAWARFLEEALEARAALKETTDV